MRKRKLSFVILAGGTGVRMGMDLPKPLIEINGITLLERAVATARKVKPDFLVTVVSTDDVAREAQRLGTEIARQAEKLGTADALKTALGKCADDGDVIVTCVDIPMADEDVFKSLYSEHIRRGAGITVLTAGMENPFGYGRIVMAGDTVSEIVEEGEATQEQKNIKSVNTGIYCIKREGLEKYLDEIRINPGKGEYYLTDIVKIMGVRGVTAAAAACSSSRKVMGVNTPEQLREVEEILSRKEG